MTPMEVPHLLTPDEARIATAAGFGSFIFLMLTRRMGWVHVLTLFIVGQVTAYYFTVPVAIWRGWSPASYGTIGFTIGALGMMFWGAVIQLAQSLRDDPKGTLSWFWRLWKGDRRYDRDDRDRRRDRYDYDPPQDGG